MKELSFTVRATYDIDAIWDYTAAHWGLAQAERYVRDLKEMCNTIAIGQRIGRLASVRQGYRTCKCGQHVIWCRDRADRIEVVRILHSVQDSDRHPHD